MLNKHKLAIYGFTLMEMMIVVVIIGVLAGISYPSYQKYITRARRSDAHVALTQIANLQEKFFTECNYYARTLEGANRVCGANSNSGVLRASTTAPVLSPDSHYVIRILAPTAGCPIANCYVLQADPATKAQGSGRQVGDGSFQIHTDGRKLWAKDGSTFTYKWTDK